MRMLKMARKTAGLNLETEKTKLRQLEVNRAAHIKTGNFLSPNNVNDNSLRN